MTEIFGMESNLNFHFNLNRDDGPDEVLPKYLAEMIDNSVRQDFVDAVELTAADRENSMYKAMRFALECAHVKILYERKVLSDKAPIIPREQFLFGFRPTDGLCIFVQKKAHKTMLCDGPIRELAKQCILTQSLQYVLVETQEFKVWSYIPVCCSIHENCPYKVRPLDMRRGLFDGTQ
jgi:hypothetical protein